MTDTELLTQISQSTTAACAEMQEAHADLLEAMKGFVALDAGMATAKSDAALAKAEASSAKIESGSAKALAEAAGTKADAAQSEATAALAKAGAVETTATEALTKAAANETGLAEARSAAEAAGAKADANAVAIAAVKSTADAAKAAIEDETSGLAATKQAATAAQGLAEGALQKSGGTMTGALAIKRAATALLNLTRPDLDAVNLQDTSANGATDISIFDKNGRVLGYFQNALFASGRSSSRLGVSAYKADGTRLINTISVDAEPDGTKYATSGSHPRNNNYGTDIVTTKWARDNFRSVVPAGFTNLYVDPVHGSDTLDLFAGRGWSKDKPFASFQAVLNLLASYSNNNEIAINLMSDMEWTATYHWLMSASMNSIVIRSDPDGSKRKLNVPSAIAVYSSCYAFRNIKINFTNSSSGGFQVNGAYRGSSPALLLSSDVELLGAAPTVISALSNAFVQVASGVSGTITGRKYAASGGSTIVGAANIPGTTAGTVDASSHVI